MEVRRVNFTNRALRTSPKFTTGVKYQFHQGFWPDQRSGNPNHPSPPYFLYSLCLLININLRLITYWGRRVIAISGSLIWPKTMMKLIFNSCVEFLKSGGVGCPNKLSSPPLWCPGDLLRSFQMLKREWVAESNGKSIAPIYP